ncbi:nitrous-oxide reductase [Halosimplex carlsbadense 2-9-1]|uniref:Nitrous-oxide reductase n=1 Tax=Halosimplex carlsbadense 2-9-1 TaxID=797114 RepID=M0CQV4_9EURY|nr:TAT-dependent nitrous-oxide reductase [Halosimplex carlsbadense]ELZ24993.1 nitrous-oxide reductase [Halosimplex carlsbadense 2-9-1]
MSNDANDSSDAESLVEEHEQRINDLVADVDDPAELGADEDDGFSMQLAGLELDRRDFMKAGAATGLASAAGAFAGCQTALPDGKTPSDSGGGGDGGSQGASASHGHFVPPGEKDEYYGFWSGGHSGEIRVIGIPSMRELQRIPVFNTEPARGYGFDDQSSEMLEQAGDYTWGDNHHPNLSETDGDYDGEYLYVNDKANGRIARVNLKYFETDAIVDVPNVQCIHGTTVLSPDTKYVLGNGEFRAPLPNDGRDVNNPEEYTALFSAVDPESMETAWQVKVDGNLDIVDTGKEGRWAISSCYNSEEATEIQGMTRDDRDYAKVFDIPAIEQAVENGNYEEVNGVPVVDGTRESDLNSGDEPLVRYISTPKSPHCVEVGPDGKYAFIAGKLSPTVTMLDLDKIGEVDDPADAVAGRPKVGLGPLHTTFDGNGHAYTSLFIDSQVAKWDIEEAANAELGSSDPVIEKQDVHYNPGHIQALEAMTTDPDGEWLISLNKLSKDRFLPVGPIHPDNDQLIHIGDGEKEMEIVADHPAYPEPHDCVFAHRDKINPATTWDKADYEGEKPFVTAENSGVERTGENSVHVKASSKRSEYGMYDFTVQEGDEVRLTVTNVEGVRDIIHGVAIPEHDVNLAVAPQDTREVTFTADDPGVYWIYCTYFCSALHLEMRSRMIVEPSE